MTSTMKYCLSNNIEMIVNDNKHQAALDGIRGFAAISVVLYHIGRWLDAQLAGNSFLAVDLFFLLSGYVLTLAYARRLDSGMNVSSFIVLRLVRLMPLVMLGTMLSSVYIVIKIQLKHDDLSIFDLGIATLLGIFNFPYLTAPPEIGQNQVFPLNGPQFSLFLELLVNTIWATSALFRKKWIVLLLSVACFALLVTVGQIGGHSPETFIAGFPRVGASFFAGIAIFHLDRHLAPWRWWPVIFGGCCLVMLVTFYAPTLPFIYQLVWIATVSPLLVLSGARTVLRGRVRTLALLSGRLSYPIYVLHYPIFVWINGTYQIVFKRRDVAIEGIILIVSIILVSLMVLKFYDEPIRYKLNRWFKLLAPKMKFRPSN